MSLMSAPDEHEAYLAARRYMDALTSGAYDQAAECVRPADLEALKKVMLEAVEIILSTHGDDDGFVAMLSSRAICRSSRSCRPVRSWPASSR